MTSDDLKLDGVTLTLEECREALAFWDRHCVGEVPRCLRLCFEDDDENTAVWYFDHRRPGHDLLALTPERIERIRDHVTPWTEVRRDEVEPGEEFRHHGREWLPLSPLVHDTDVGYLPATSPDGVARHTCGPLETVLVRRPRKPALTLRDLEPGQRFRFVKSEGYVHRRTVQGWLEEATWAHMRLLAGDDIADTPVELVDE